MNLISSLDDPRVAPFLHLREVSPRNAEEKFFVVENSKVVRRLLKSDCAVRLFFATESYLQDFMPLLKKKGLEASQILITEERLMNQIVGYAMHEGVMALAVVPPIQYLWDSVREIALPAVCLCGVVDAENVGAIVRNCAAFGVRSLIIDQASSSPYLRRAVRVSLGGIFALTVYRTENAAEAFREMKSIRPDVRVVAFETSPEAALLENASIPQNSVIVFGSEAKGLDEGILSSADNVVKIGMKPLAGFDAVNSLNVAASSAVVLHYLAVNQ